MTDPATHRPALTTRRLLGEGVGAALIQPDGVIDWWCPNRFEAEPVLWALLDRRGGESRWMDVEAATWDPCPAGPTAHSTVRLGTQRVELWDGLVAVDGGGSMLVRLVRSTGPAVAMVHRLRIGGFDGPSAPWIRDGDHVTNGPLVVSGGRPAIEAGEVVIPVTAETDRWSGFAVLAEAQADADLVALVSALRRAEATQARATARLRLPRQHASRATDALRVMRSLTDPRTGAPVAAPTTSLPEAVGGERQFDYRYSWLRDSGLAVGTASALGHLSAAEHYLGFVGQLLERDGGLHPMSTTAGGEVPPEREVAEVHGWAGSRPVRVGNGARDQVQLDAVAGVIAAVGAYVASGGRLDRATWGIVDDLAGRLADQRGGPTSGVWELRTPRRLVSEEIARWHGLEVALRLRRWTRPWLRRPAWRSTRNEARRRVEAAIDQLTGRLPQSFDDSTDPTPDAAALTVATTGLLARRDPRAVRLVTATIEALEHGPFLRRYPPADDGFEGIEGAFVPVSWWAVTALACVGELDAARTRADELCAALPPLQPEEWNVEEGTPLGNLPLLWSHMETARALYTLEREELRRRVGTIGVLVWAAARYVRL
ncbi:MAG: glycoside hydrolase family 15 protein, partial [Ilumatobacteraceae bacterium]